MRRAIRIIAIFALVFIPFLACMDFGGGEEVEGCGPYELPPLCLFPPCSEPDPCRGVVCPPDDNVCTREYCSGGSCRSEPVTNGSSCTYDGLSGVCVEGVCGENLCEDVVCDDGDACTEGTCDYVDGTCDYTPVVCDDHEECTEDTCDPTDGCVFTAVEDGTECSGPYGMCEAGSCVAPCDLASDEEYPCPITGLEGLFCCPGSEYCRDYCPECERPEDCDDDDACTEDSCDYANGTCYFTPAVCNDQNPCTEDTCDPLDGCIFTAVEDGTRCGSQGQICVAGECLCRIPEDCGDGNECTEDLCVDGICANDPVVDNTECDFRGLPGLCISGRCEDAGLCEQVDCSDGNVCTDDICDPADGSCDNPVAENGTPCAEGMCIDGTCEPIGSVFPCTEQGIRLAIAVGGGPYTFDCGGPQTVITGAKIRIDNNAILEGEGNLTVDANDTHLVFSVASGVTAELRGFTVSGGKAPYGGGIYNSGALTLTNSTVSGNSAERDGGGIFNYGTVTLTNSTVSENTSGGYSENNGGGIVNRGTATLTNSTVSGNSAKLGGGFYNVGSGALTLTNSTVSGNSAEHGGGGIVNFETVTLTNSTVSGNTTGDYTDGSGILNAFGGALTLTNSTVSGNSAELGGNSIYNCSGCALTLTNTVVDGKCTYMYDTPIRSNGNNIESPLDTCGFDQEGDQASVTEGQLNLGPLADNGGPTMTHKPGDGGLGEGSEAIDRIPGDACDLTEDQRGEPRPEPGGSMCDVGSVEVQP